MSSKFKPNAALVASRGFAFPRLDFPSLEATFFKGSSGARSHGRGRGYWENDSAGGKTYLKQKWKDVLSFGSGTIKWA